MFDRDGMNWDRFIDGEKTAIMARKKRICMQKIHEWGGFYLGKIALLKGLSRIYLQVIGF